MAHNINFSIDEINVNRIGITLGREYISEKYKNGQDNVVKNLSFCLEEIVNRLGRTIYIEIGTDMRKGK